MNLRTELESYLKRYLKKKIVLDDCYITAENSEKKWHTQGTAPKTATCYLYKLPDYKFTAEDEKYYLFTTFKSHL